MSLQKTCFDSATGRCIFMKLLAISEHFFPRVGGTVNYVHETLCALARQGVETELLVPGPAPENWLPAGMATPPYRVRCVDAGYPPSGDPCREARYDFCRKVDALAWQALAGPDRPDVLHVLFGLFVMEVLDTGRLRAAGLPCLSTVHNVPPMECRQTAHNAPLPARLREELRLKAVGLKNRARLRKNRYDLHIAPSEQVKGFLEPVVKDPVAVIGHGLTSDLLAHMAPPASRRPDPGAPLRLLTVGGYAPHKRQHLIPEVAKLLQKQGINFEWDVVGPEGRIKGYHDSVHKAAQWASLEDRLRIHGAVPFTDLAQLYDAAHLYVQPSVEEGFCITALDAAAAGVPVIASPAGALARIANVSGGTLVDSASEPLAQAISDFVFEDRWADAAAQAHAVRSAFSWDTAARTLLERYKLLIRQRVTDHA